MTYLFYKLEKNYSALLYAANYPESFRESSGSFLVEIELIKKQLKDLYFSTYSEQSFENFLNLHHSSLLEMLDSLSKHLDIERTKARLGNVPRGDELCNLLQIYWHLQELLEFFYSLFSKFICKQQLIPKEVLTSPIMEMKQCKAFLEENIPENICKNIKAQLLKPFNQFIGIRPKATWHNLLYCRSLFKELVKLITSNPDLSTEDLIWLLYGLNYNSKAFYNSIANYILALHHDNYLECLYYFLRKVRQTFIHPNTAYNPNNLSLKKMLERWIKEEIAFIKNTAQLKLPLDTGGKQDEKTIQENKILTTLSVAELAYIFKLLSDANFLKINNPKQLFRSLANTCRTPKSENISPESLRSKFYKPEPATQNMVKGRLIELLNQIRLKAP